MPLRLYFRQSDSYWKQVKTDTERAARTFELCVCTDSYFQAQCSLAAVCSSTPAPQKHAFMMCAEGTGA